METAVDHGGSLVRLSSFISKGDDRIFCCVGCDSLDVIMTSYSLLFRSMYDHTVHGGCTGMRLYCLIVVYLY